MSSRQMYRNDADSKIRTPSKIFRVSLRRETSPVETMDEGRDENQLPFGCSFVESRIANKTNAPEQRFTEMTSEREEREGWEDDDDKPAEITPTRRSRRITSKRNATRTTNSVVSMAVLGFPATSIDPFETPARENDGNAVFASESGIRFSNAKGDVELPGGERVAVGGCISNVQQTLNSHGGGGGDDDDDDMARLRLLAGKLSADWKSQDFMAPALARRIRDFQFAQEKRRRKYGDERPWGILGVYEHLSAIRVDVEWAEDSAWRRANGESYVSWTDFEASKKKGIHRPFFTYFLLLVCTFVLIASIALNGWRVEPLNVNTMIGPSAETLILMGAKDSDLIVNKNEAWRLVTSVVLHAGLVHYFLNMLALWFVGSAVEMTHGFAASIIFFIIPAIGGTILSAIFLPEYITVGASGGIFGLIGACLSDIVVNWKLLFSDFVNENGKKSKHATIVGLLVLDIFLNSIIGLTPFVDNFTHLGGMVLGFLCGISTMERLSSDFFGVEQSCVSKAKQVVIRFFGIIVSVLGIIIATIVLFNGDGGTTPCPKCTWLSCVPFPPWKGPQDKWWYCDDCGRVIAEIISSPSLHLQMECPDGTSVPVALDPEREIDRNELEKKLPSYCREYCPTTDRDL